VPESSTKVSEVFVCVYIYRLYIHQNLSSKLYMNFEQYPFLSWTSFINLFDPLQMFTTVYKKEKG